MKRQHFRSRLILFVILTHSVCFSSGKYLTFWQKSTYLRGRSLFCSTRNQKEYFSGDKFMHAEFVALKTLIFFLVQTQCVNAWRCSCHLANSLVTKLQLTLVRRYCVTHGCHALSPTKIFKNHLKHNDLCANVSCRFSYGFFCYNFAAFYRSFDLWNHWVYRYDRFPWEFTLDISPSIHPRSVSPSLSPPWNRSAS